jgi:hypothetical protein
LLFEATRKAACTTHADAERGIQPCHFAALGAATALKK